MDLRFEKMYDKKAGRINKLREALKADPDNQALKEVIEEKEKQLFRYVVNTGKELEKFMQKEKEENPYEEAE